MCRYRSVWIAAPRSMFAGNRRCARLRQYTPSGQGLWRLPVRESDFGSGYHYTTWLGARCRVFDENKNPFLSEDGGPRMEHSVPEGQGQYHGCLDMRRHPELFALYLREAVRIVPNPWTYRGCSAFCGRA